MISLFLRRQNMFQNGIKIIILWLEQIVLLTIACNAIAGTSKKNDATSGLVAQPSLPYLTKAEVDKMQLLRLWHTKPVVENFELGADLFQNNSDSLDLNYLPEQIQGRHARLYSKRISEGARAKEVACHDDLSQAKDRHQRQVAKNYKAEVYDKLNGVVRMSGLTYAKSSEPTVNRQNSDRYKYTTSIQAGQNFSFGGWIRFARPEVETEIYELQNNDDQNSRYKLRSLVPDYYTFLGKSPDKFNKLPNYDRQTMPEWQFYMTSEMLYLGSYQGSESHDYYRVHSGQNAEAIMNFKQYEECLARQSAYQETYSYAQPLARSKKPVPSPVDTTPPPVMTPPPRERCDLYPILVPPTVGGGDKKHILDFNIKQFNMAETWSSSYIKTKADNDGVHYEAWHFLNVSFDLANPVMPKIKLSIISLPYLDRLPKNEAYNSLARCIYKMKNISQVNSKAEMFSGGQCKFSEIEFPLDTSTSALAQLLMNETDSPVLIGAGEIEGDWRKGGAKMNDRVYRSGTYISRSVLNRNQVLRMAEVLFPSSAINCKAKDLKPLIPSRTDFASEY